MADRKAYEEIPFSDELFPIRILWNCRPGKVGASDPDAPGLWHEQLEILFVLTGKITVECGYRRYVCDAGDIVVVNPCETHSVGYCSGEPSYHCFMIDPRLYDSGRSDLCGIKYLLPMNGRRLKFNNLVRGNEKASGLLRDLVTECSEKPYAYELAVKADILRLLAELFRSELSALSGADADVSDRSGFELISPVFSYIAEHYRTRIGLEELARLCCITPSHLCRVFKKVTGKTVVDYINEFRIEKAQALLLTTDRSIADVACEVGFSDGGYFSRRFKALNGFPPGELRTIKSKDGKRRQPT